MIYVGLIKAVEGAVILDQIKDSEYLLLYANTYCYYQCLLIENQQPQMIELFRYVVKRSYAVQWFDIGMELGLHNVDLEIIKCNNPMDEEYCFRRTLSKWLERTVNPTWKALEVALTNVNRAKLGLNSVDDPYEHGKAV